MYIDNEKFEAWMERIMDRFDLIDRLLEKLGRRQNMLGGERLYDNQDMCQLLNISKRTLQRYRSSGELPYHMIYHKTYYKESDIHTFIRFHFNEQDAEGNAEMPAEDPENENPEKADESENREGKNENENKEDTNDNTEDAP